MNDDNLSDIKEDLVDEAREDQKQTGSDGGKSDSDDKGKTYTTPIILTTPRTSCPIPYRTPSLEHPAKQVFVFSRAREIQKTLFGRVEH